MGSPSFDCLYPQDPMPSESAIFKVYWMSNFYPEPTMERAQQCELVVISADLAFKGNDDSDFNSLQIWGATRADRYLLDEVHLRADFSQILGRIRSLVAKFPKYTALIIGDTANGPAIISTLKREIPGVIPVKPEGGKVVRANVVSAQFEAGNVWLPSLQYAPRTGEWQRELIEFPMNSGGHDDRVDSCSQCLNWLKQRMNPVVGINRNAIVTPVHITGQGFSSGFINTILHPSSNPWYISDLDISGSNYPIVYPRN